ncbi:hypothetical protein [Salicola sp. Rm-C-2C1-2]|uniref:hypothetical protein n=1 Tax=Salicola sp. Rm-C-2C1-2 TaxID=3141321 RepID=UPI0032E36F38
MAINATIIMIAALDDDEHARSGDTTAMVAVITGRLSAGLHTGPVSGHKKGGSAEPPVLIRLDL